MKVVQRTVILALFLAVPITEGCRHHRRDSRIIITNPTGTVAGDFRSIADYLADPTVRFLLSHMPRHQGGTPPDVEGEYDSEGLIVRRTIPGTRVGDPVIGDFCFGSAAGTLIEVTIQDVTVVDAGASSFIEGSGDAFTIYTAFKSVQTQDDGTTCEIHEVNVFSAVRNADGSLSDLFIGQGIVGLIGNCSDLLAGDIQISENIADRVGASCNDGSPGSQPQNPANVLVRVENNLVVDLLVFLDDDTVPTILVGALSAGEFETAPGFALYFETVLPVAGQDPQGNDLLMGELVNGQFPVDVTGAGGSIAYVIENQVGDDIFFAPLPLNRADFEIFSVVNSGVAIPGYPDPPGSGLDCLCSMAPSIDPYVVGYYSYSVPGVINATQANVRFFKVSNGKQVDAFVGPFNLEELSGTVTLRVD